MGGLIYLLDTNTISEPTKPSPNQQVIEHLKKFEGQFALPVFVIYEMIYGAYRLPESKKRSRILHYIQDIIDDAPILLYTQEAAYWHGKEEARLQSIGKSPPFIDTQIAAVAKVNNLILVTRNTDDFKHFSDIQLENWFDT
jgi:tRNA(fMet)-specific endonuclease VapC